MGVDEFAAAAGAGGGPDGSGPESGPATCGGGWLGVDS